MATATVVIRVWEGAEDQVCSFKIQVQIRRAGDRLFLLVLGGLIFIYADELQ
jgi:hypothetical protein